VPGVARKIKNREKISIFEEYFLIYAVTLRVLKGSLKKCQPIWFSRLASYDIKKD